jgi:DNA polymerase-3 subunit gamma/tau
MQQAEATVAADPFVQEMGRQLGAFVVQGSVRPPAAAA